MKIKENMFIRTKNGEIAKLIGNANGKYSNIDKFKNDGITLRTIKNKDIAKASFDIIDLIEVGDYVNGNEVLKIDNYVEELNKDSEIHIDSIFINYLYEDEIKTIVTHEQMQQMEYRIGE
jgi:hypothetical protein